MQTEKQKQKLAELREWAANGVLRQTRETAQRTTWELANELGVVQPLVINWEHGLGLTRPKSDAVFSYYKWLRKHGAGKEAAA